MQKNFLFLQMYKGIANEIMGLETVIFKNKTGNKILNNWKDNKNDRN